MHKDRFLPDLMRLLPAFLTSVLLTFGLATTVAAQEVGLARDFEKLSAKQRARIAKEEQEAARVDVGFQAVMTQAEDLFRQLRYEGSMTKFKEARVMRPYNVYPKVKIQDLQALIAKRDAEAAAAALVPEPAITTKAPAEPPIPVVQAPVELVSTAQPGTVSPARLVIGDPVREPSAEVSDAPRPTLVEEPVRVVPAEKADPPVEAVQKVMAPPTEAPVLVEGERVYKEGRSVVVERTVQQDDHLVVFRKVTHPWGEVNHFRDGVPVSERAYQRAMDDR